MSKYEKNCLTEAINYFVLCFIWLSWVDVFVVIYFITELKGFLVFAAIFFLPAFAYFCQARTDLKRFKKGEEELIISGLGKLK